MSLGNCLHFSAPLKSQHGQLKAKASSIPQCSTNLSPPSITLISKEEKDLPTFKAYVLKLAKVTGEWAWLSRAWRSIEDLSSETRSWSHLNPFVSKL